MQIKLPALINPPRLRKDGSASIAFETRELTAEEIFTIMSLRHTEGWLLFSPNEDDMEVPDEKPQVEAKSPSERLRNVMYVWYKQQTEDGKYVGLFETFRNEKMEILIEHIKSKLKN